MSDMKELPAIPGDGGTGLKVVAQSQSVCIASDQTPIPISGTFAAASTRYVNIAAPYENDCSSSPINTGAWTQLIASTSAAIFRIHFYNGAGISIKLAIGGAGAESEIFRIVPGGEMLDFYVAASTRISIQPTANLTDGLLIVNYLGVV